MLNNRRTFFLQLAVAGSALKAGSASAQAMVSETDPQAKALADVSDTTRVDPKKYPKHTKDQRCVNCQIYQGKPSDTAGGCPLFAGKRVAANGWCNAWIKKA
jgi:hypothetical protein